MTEAKIETPNIKFNGVKLQIFDKIGFNSGTNWVVNAFEGCFVEITPEPIRDIITQMINADIDAGNVDEIDHICLKPSHILRLFLEGGLPTSTIVNAVDYESEVLFKDVPFMTSSGVMIFQLLVGLNYEMATINKNGEVV